MSKELTNEILSIAKKTLIAGYAVSLFVPYRVERFNEETTYHAPLYKLSYKRGTQLTNENKEKKVHTYTITTFGLLCDQLSSIKRLYTAALLKKPYYKERAQRKITCASDKVGDAFSRARGGARKTARVVALGFKRTQKLTHGAEEHLCRIVDDIFRR